jgi:dethiobiotin synthetase
VHVNRPKRLVFVSGTGTEVGKTWWTVAIAVELQARGVSVSARKPVQSSAPGEEPDADVLAGATGETPRTVCPLHRTYDIPWAPPMAAAELGLPAFSVRDLAAELLWTPDLAVGLVEGVGGPRSPIATDGDNVDFARAIQPDLVVVVAPAGLGTINAVRLCADAFDDFPMIVALNRFGDDVLHARNRDFLIEHADLDVVTAPAQLAESLQAR